ncbi:MAG: ABC transporter ATP-binding protein/permease [Treponema sp.]|jgi:ATP-binding cassette subfamily B protein|nr:ABC transporter ATP-binding protein/permease [Treponema sp.]
MEQIIWVWNYMKGKRAVFMGGLILSIVTAAIRVINPMLGQRIIDEVVMLRNTDPLIPLLVAMMIVQVSRLSLHYLMIILMEIASTDVMTRIRRDMYETVQWQDYRFLGRFPTGNLMTRMTQDLDRLRHTVAWVSYQFIGAVALFVSTFTFYMFINWRLALCLVAITPFILYISHRFKKRLRPRFQLLRQKLTDLGTAVTENIDGNRVVRAFARESYEKKKIEAHNADFRDTSCENALIVAKYQPLLDTASQLLMVVMLLVGGFFLIKEWMTAGQYMAFSSLTWALAAPMQMLGPLLADLERYTASGEMIREVVEAPKGISDAPDAVELKERPLGDIEFKDVNLSINGTPVLHDINFKIEAGATIGILGSTGSGKTSLINLLMRFYEPDSGQTLLDGVDLRRYTLSSLRKYVGTAMQDVFLFSDSVKGNIAYGMSEMDEETIRRRAVQADADSFIKDMSEGYETLVGERGVGLSGGQRQRVALARALAVEPAVLVLDDTTSAVDSETEKFIQEQLKTLDFPCTKIIIAQRISSFRGADMILVMDKGRIIERGTHSELLAMRGFYHHIWSLQYNAGLDAISEFSTEYSGEGI